MIGVFDSGYGGLTILDEIRRTLPQYSTIYLGDNAHAPYGPKTDEEIFELTKQGVEHLFQKGCSLVILACNTASASALRRLQQEWLFTRRSLGVGGPENVLGIIVPTAEAVSEHQATTIGILATQHTVNTGVYEKEIHKRNSEIMIIQQPCNNLAGMIEQYGPHHERVVDEMKNCIQNLFSQTTPPSLRGARGGFFDAVLLACTHYELIAEHIQQLLPESTMLIRQPTIVAESLQLYLQRHPEIERILQKDGTCQYFTTGNPIDVSAKSSLLMQEDVVFEAL